MLREELVDVSLDDAGLAAAEFPHHEHLEDVLRVVAGRGGGHVSVCSGSCLSLPSLSLDHSDKTYSRVNLKGDNKT